MNKKYFGLFVSFSVVSAFALTTSSIAPTGNGTYSAWTPSTGTTHYTLVDESVCNGVTDYVSTATVGARDSFSVSLASVPNGATITNISVTPCASKTTSSKSAGMNIFYRLNGTNSANSAVYTLSGTTPINLTATNYSGLSVVKNGSTTLEIGAVLATGATTGARLSKLATVITYTDVVPADPTNLVGQVVSSSTLTYARITWTDNSSNETTFKIERGLDGVNFTQISSTTPNITQYNDLNVATGTTYYYRVRAANATGNSGYTNVVSVTMP